MSARANLCFLQMAIRSIVSCCIKVVDVHAIVWERIWAQGYWLFLEMASNG